MTWCWVLTYDACLPVLLCVVRMPVLLISLICLILARDVCVWPLIYFWCLPVMLCRGLCNRACVVGLGKEALGGG